MKRFLLGVSSAALLATALTATPSNAATTFRPLDNDCSAGYVTFTFDDGPDNNTPAVMNTLLGLNLKGVFFVTGQKMHNNPAGQQMVRDLVANGFRVENHTYDHRSFTGESTGTTPMTEAQVVSELNATTDEMASAGIPAPTLYRPPFGDINSFDDNVAQRLGLRVVESWSTLGSAQSPGGNIIDSKDWQGASVQQIVDVVTKGRTNSNGTYPAANDKTIVAMHDGQAQSTLNTIDALQPIVDWMNTKHLCSTNSVRADATGGVIAPPAPQVPSSGNLVSNPSLETLRLANTPASEPVCWQQGGASTSQNTGVWKQTSDAFTGNVAERIDVTNWNAGDRKLVLTQKESERAACLPAASPGSTYQMWVHYKGDWQYQGAGITKVSVAAYYRNSAGAWVYWTGSPLYPPTSQYSVAYLKTPPLPAGATAVSYGLAIQGVGSLTTDDYFMTAS